MKLFRCGVFSLILLSVSVAYGVDVSILVDDAYRYSAWLLAEDGTNADEHIGSEEWSTNGICYKNVDPGTWWVVMRLQVFSGNGGPVDLDALKIEVESNNVFCVFGNLEEQTDLCVKISSSADVMRIQARMQRITDNEIEPVFEQWISLAADEQNGERSVLGKILGPMHPGKYLFTVQHDYRNGEFPLIGSAVVEVPAGKKPDVLHITMNSGSVGEQTVRERPSKVTYETDIQRGSREAKALAKQRRAAVLMYAEIVKSEFDDLAEEGHEAAQDALPELEQFIQQLGVYEEEFDLNESITRLKQIREKVTYLSPRGLPPVVDEKETRALLEKAKHLTIYGEGGSESDEFVPLFAEVSDKKLLNEVVRAFNTANFVEDEELSEGLYWFGRCGCGYPYIVEIDEEAYVTFMGRLLVCRYGLSYHEVRDDDESLFYVFGRILQKYGAEYDPEDKTK